MKKKMMDLLISWRSFWHADCLESHWRRRLIRRYKIEIGDNTQLNYASFSNVILIIRGHSKAL